jgi:hypothetical protein
VPERVHGSAIEWGERNRGGGTPVMKDSRVPSESPSATASSKRPSAKRTVSACELIAARMIPSQPSSLRRPACGRHYPRQSVWPYGQPLKAIVGGVLVGLALGGDVIGQVNEVIDCCPEVQCGLSLMDELGGHVAEDVNAQ